MNQSNKSGITMKLHLFFLFFLLLAGESPALERRVMGNDFERGLQGWRSGMREPAFLRSGTAAHC